MKTCCSTTGENPQHRDFFVKTQSLQYRDKVSHTGELWKISKSPHTTPQSPHTGELWKISKPHTPANYENLQSLHTPHSTEPTHRGTLKIFKVSTHHRAHTPENFENFQNPNTQHRAHTPGNFENFLKSPYSTEPTHRGTLWKFSKSPHTTVPPHQGTLNILKVHTAQSPHTGKL